MVANSSWWNVAVWSSLYSLCDSFPPLLQLEWCHYRQFLPCCVASDKWTISLLKTKLFSPWNDWFCFWYFGVFAFPLSHLCRFGANSPGDSPGKFARPGSAQPELHKQLVSGQRAGEHAGEQCNASKKSASNELTEKVLYVPFKMNHFQFFPWTGWWAEPRVEWKGPITPGEVQLPCGDDGGTSQWNYSKYFPQIMCTSSLVLFTRLI